MQQQMMIARVIGCAMGLLLTLVSLCITGGMVFMQMRSH